jgi:hypothetical protein
MKYGNPLDGWMATAFLMQAQAMSRLSLATDSDIMYILGESVRAA